jgi:hypothetical protein
MTDAPGAALAEIAAVCSYVGRANDFDKSTFEGWLQAKAEMASAKRNILFMFLRLIHSCTPALYRS